MYIFTPNSMKLKLISFLDKTTQIDADLAENNLGRKSFSVCAVCYHYNLISWTEEFLYK